ncbi:30S ribosomal protein S7 [Patescibacteria group bacterium]|nr:MAG: 30S ribosomal protein S7 [Patescibacteria group bacterium]
MRGKQAPKRVIAPDSKYGSVVIAKLVNSIMKAGKKTTAQKVVYAALDIVAEQSKDDPAHVFDAAMRNVTPQIEVVSRRVGGANYQIPIPVRGERRTALAFRWLIAAANSRKGKPMSEKLASEILEAAKGEGSAVKKRMDVQRMAEANRAFAHFAR